MESAKQTPKRDSGLWRYALVPVALLLLACTFYAEENWRGHHSWNVLKQRLEASGGYVDWTNYIPAPVPDDENVFGIAKMQQWFTGRGGNDLTSRIDHERNSFLDEHHGGALATVTVVKRADEVGPGDADVTLVYDSALSALALETEHTSSLRSNEPIPLIVMDEVPLNDAIKNLAHAAGMNYMLNLKSASTAQAQPWESGRWEGLRAREVLGAILKKDDLQYVPDSKTGIGVIMAKPRGSGDVAIEPGITNRLEELLSLAMDAATNKFHGECAYTAMGVMLTAEPAVEVRPARIVIRSDEVPTAKEVAAFFPSLKNAYYPNLTSDAQVEATGSNSFAVRMKPIAQIGAEEYLKWSDGFAEDIDAIRGALKRPYAQMRGDYHDPIAIPIPNFICQRVMAQTLTDRAKCHLLLRQPDKALQEMALVRDLCVLMEGRPHRRPTTLVATMIDSAITGLYVETIAEGMRLGAWREPELVALQAQLKQIDLLPLLAESFELERASACRTMETITADRFANFMKGSPGASKASIWQRLKDPNYAMIELGPRGWIYGNMTRVALLHEQLLQGLDVTNRRVSSGHTEKTTDETIASLGHFSPYNYLAAVMVPNFARAVQTLSHNQCLAQEALIACALERYRLAHNEYPKTLNTLVPQYLEKIPSDIINGQPLKYRLKSSDQFVIYSVGWNETDDGGVPGPKKDGYADLKQGDWVWAVR